MAAGAIRQIGLPDRALLRSAMEQFVEGESISDERITEFVAAGNTWAFVALGSDTAINTASDTDAGGDIRGWAWGSLQPDLERGRRSSMTCLEVHPAHRRDGIGTLLLEAAFGHAQRNRCCDLRVVLDAMEHPEAMMFFASTAAEIIDQKVVHWSI